MHVDTIATTLVVLSFAHALAIKFEANTHRNKVAWSLAEFRDAVVQRPTPPYEAFQPQPLADAMRASPMDASVQAKSCTKLDGQLGAKPALQEPYFIHGVHKLAIQAMKSFESNAEVQLACSYLLSNMAQWNWVLSRAMADAGALDAMVGALKNHPGDSRVRALTGGIGSFCDFDTQNKEHMIKLGLIELVYNNTDKHYNTNEVAQMYNLWSTLCSIPSAAEAMVQKGELERGVRAMQVHKKGTVRGEVMTINQECFMGRLEWKQMMIDAGIIPEIVSTIRDEVAGPDELDAVGKRRLLSHAFDMLKQFAEIGSAARATILESGGAEAILLALQDDAANGDHTQHGFSELQGDIRDEACNTLATLQPAREQVLQHISTSALSTVLRNPVYGANANHPPKGCTFFL